MTLKKESTPANIETDLSTIWNSLKESNKIHACLFNLILYVHEIERVPHYQEIIQTIIEKFPCRIFFIQNAGAKAASLAVEVAAEAVGKQTGERVACDVITIHTSSYDLYKIPFIILPHLVSDLPIFLLWAQDPNAENEIFPHFKEYATRIIFDSDCRGNLSEFAHKMHELIDSTKTDVVDLNWASISRWREMLGQIVETKAQIQGLLSAKEIRIGYNAKEKGHLLHPETQAIYFQAWLASRLHWKYYGKKVTQNELEFIYIHQNKEIHVILNKESIQDIPNGEILGIEITATGDCVYQLQRKITPPRVLVHTSNLETCELPFILPLPLEQQGLKFWKETFYQNLSEHYAEMLKLIELYE